MPDWLDEFHDYVATYDDEALAEAEDDAVSRAVPLQSEAEPADGAEVEIALLKRMERWALAHEAEPDAKARELINYLVAVCRPDGRHWTNERVVVFTEYRDTQRWLGGLLRQQGIAAPEIAQLHGGIGADEREQLRLAFLSRVR